MRSLRLSFAECRHRKLALRVAEIEWMGARSTITPIGLAAFAVGSVPPAAQVGAMHTNGAGSQDLTIAPSLAGAASASPSRAPVTDTESIAIVPHGGGAGGGALPDVPQAGDPAASHGVGGGDPLAFVRSLGLTGGQSGAAPALAAPWKPARSLGSGGGALPSRGGSGGPSSHPAPLAGTPAANGGRNAASSPSSASAASSAALLSTLGLNGSSAAGASVHPPAAASGTTITRNALAQGLGGASVTPGTSTPSGGPLTPSGSPAFTLIVLDDNDGSPMVPGAYQLATPGGAVDLRAQVIDSASGTYSYSWNTSGLTDATGISGASSFDLTFHWNTSIATAGTQTVTLTVTDPNSNQVSQSYTFWAPAASGTTTGGTTWPTSLDPGLLSAASPSVASKNVSVVSATGAAEASIDLPSFNPNVATVSLQYDSLSANALPIIDVEHPLDPAQSTPSTVTAQLTFDGSAGTTWYYNTGSLTPGDIMQIGLQANGSSLSTGRYGYSAQVIDYRGGTPTTFTYGGTATLINEAQDPTFSALGAGWTVSGLEKIVTASGGVILDEGSGAGLWFSGSFGVGGGTYTSPAGDFSTLVLNSNGTYTRTLTDGTVENFNSSGLETSSVDRNGLTTTFGYSGNLLQTITDPFSEVVTFTYSGGYLQSIQDTANRLATFTISGGDLTAVQYPDTNSWDYGYDSSGRLTSVTEPSSTGEPTKITTITYDSAGRVGTVTRADSTTEEFSAAQEQGWTNTGTSTNPATPTLLAQVSSTYTDPVGDVTMTRPDWRGMGLIDQAIDALGGVATADRDANGLATIAIDPMNRITQDAFDSKGNVTKVTNPDGSTVTYGTYNSFAEPASMTDELNRTTYYTYDPHGNRTVVEDPATNVTTYTYSSTQPGMLTAQTAPRPLGQSSYTLFSYQYDAKDRLTTMTDADSDVTVKAYNSAGQVTQVTDPSNHVVTCSYDPMNQVTAMATAAGTSLAGLTSYTYDKAGNQLTTTDPNGYTTTTTYDALDRQSTVENADDAVTTSVYDDAGRLNVLIDPVGNRTTFLYDPLGRLTTQVSPSVNSSSGETSTAQYDADGEATQTTDADSRVITYSYDSRGDQTGESWLNGAGSAIYIATYTYDSARQMTGAADNSSLLTIAYDNGGRVGTIATSGPGTGQPTVTLTYGYDPSGDVTSIQDSLGGSGYAGQGLTTYTYDSALRLATIVQSFGGNSGPIVLDTYNPNGTLSETQREVALSGNRTSVNTSYTYDANNNVTGISDFKTIYNGSLRTNQPTGAGGGGTYNASGQTTAVSYDGGTKTNTYTYDPAGQLINSGDGFAATYSYDLNGNRNMTGSTTGAGNELTSSPGVTYTYDDNGNRITATTSSGTTTYTYDYENRLTSVDVNGTVVVTYTYDALGRRIGIQDNGTQTWTVFDGTSTDSNPYAEFNGSGSVTVRYLFGPAVNQILARTSSSGTIAWYMTNQLGSVTDLINTTGTDLDQITYDPYGNIVSQTGSSYADRFLFAGMQYDTAAGLYYDHARYYDPSIGIFICQDPLGFYGGDTNLTCYVFNAPTNLTDPSGLQDSPQGGGGMGTVRQPIDYIHDYTIERIRGGGFPKPGHRAPANNGRGTGGGPLGGGGGPLGGGGGPLGGGGGPLGGGPGGRHGRPRGPIPPDPSRDLIGYYLFLQKYDPVFSDWMGPLGQPRRVIRWVPRS